MRCPQCGRWNRATLPQCFYCGAALPSSGPQDAARTDDALQPPASVIYEVDESGEKATPRPDARDSLAREMQSFHSRRKRGEEQQRRIRQEGLQWGYGSTTRTVQLDGEPTRVYEEPDSPAVYGDDSREKTRPGAVHVRHRQPETPEYDDTEDAPSYQPVWREDYRPRPRAGGMAKRTMRHIHVYGLRRFFPFLSLVLIVGVLAAAGYLFVLRPLLSRAPDVQEATVEIVPSLLDDMAAHTIRIPAEEGAQIYIKELRKSYIATGGYAEFTVADYVWYELESDIESDQMDVTLTPYIKTSAGEQKLMDIITYPIDIPLSPLVLVTPDTAYLEVSTSPYNIRFRVAQNSTVFINGEDYSSYVNTQDGYISYNAQVAPIGNNEIEIVVNCQYYRQNKITITLYRAPQDVPLELSATLGNTSANQTMTITGTTVAGASLRILSDYENLDISDLATNGRFSFQAKFSKIGNNTIVIISEKEGKSTTLTKDVYYVPYSSTYTPKAWPMDATNYLDFLNNTSTRVQRTQIYVCIGTIKEILSSKPQLALMDTGTEGSERLVMLENMSTDTWEVGERYRIYADAYGTYDGKPRLVARYTYRPLN